MEKSIRNKWNQEDDTPNISLTDKYYSALIALSLAKYLGCITDKDINNNNLNIKNTKQKLQ